MNDPHAQPPRAQSPEATRIDAPKAPAPPIFRPEAIAHARGDSQGVLLLTHAPGMTWLAYALFLAFLLAIGILAFTPHARKLIITTILLPDRGMIDLHSPRAGHLTETLVEVGQTVQAGQLLMLIGHDMQAWSGQSVGAAMHESVQAQLRLIEEELSALSREKDLVTQRHRQLTEDMDSRLKLLVHEQHIARQRLAIAQRNLEQHRALHGTEFVSTAAVQASHAKTLEAENAVLALTRAQQSLEHERNSTGVATTQATQQVNQKRLAVEQRRQALVQTLAQGDAQRQTYLRAPRTGVIAKLGAAPGQRITPADRLVSIVPEGASLQAVGHVPSAAVGLIKRGMPVYLRYDAYPYQHFGQHTGGIAGVSAIGLPLSANGQHEFFEIAEREQQPLYEVKIDIPSQALQRDGEQWALHSGMRVQAAIVLDRRTLFARTLDLLQRARAGIERSS